MKVIRREIGLTFLFILTGILLAAPLFADTINNTDIGAPGAPAAGDGISDPGDQTIVNNADVYVTGNAINTGSHSNVTNNGIAYSSGDVAVDFTDGGGVVGSGAMLVRSSRGAAFSPATFSLSAADR